MAALDLAAASAAGFGPEHLPYGVVVPPGASPRLAVRVGGTALDLAALAEAGLVDIDPARVGAAALNPLMAAGPQASEALRASLQDLLADPDRVPADALHDLADVTVEAPVAIADYVDFYSSIEHATNVGKLFRPDAEPLLPNWRHLPVGYHGRAGTVVASGTPIRRPHGQRKGDDGPTFGPSERLDIELELGVVTGVPSTLGEPVEVDRAAAHVFGVTLVNDWSARDLQAWEYVPLGPFLAKSFATSTARWITPLAALEPFWVPGPEQEPEPLPYLRATEPRALDIQLEVGLRSAAMAAEGADFDVVSRTGFAGMYWSFAQQLAHATVAGATIRTGDLYASGTVSGATPGSEGSLLELTWGGSRPLTLSDGSERSFLADGDEVVLRGRCSDSITLDEVRGTITP